eukprot:scaffold3350_cov268-Pinguiococcus_pyrenoidosus.AAC.19
MQDLLATRKLAEAPPTCLGLLLRRHRRLFRRQAFRHPCLQGACVLRRKAKRNPKRQDSRIECGGARCLRPGDVAARRNARRRRSRNGTSAKPANLGTFFRSRQLSSAELQSRLPEISTNALSSRVGRVDSGGRGPRSWGRAGDPSRIAAS